jgi:hypothetical protein
MLAVASLLGLLMALTRNDIGYLAVLVWAFAGIAIKQVSAPIVVTTAWIVCAVMVGLIVYSAIRMRLSARQTDSP